MLNALLELLSRSVWAIQVAGLSLDCCGKNEFAVAAIQLQDRQARVQNWP
jgi:hypothetical protein